MCLKSIGTNFKILVPILCPLHGMICREYARLIQIWKNLENDEITYIYRHNLI